MHNMLTAFICMKDNRDKFTSQNEILTQATNLNLWNRRLGRRERERIREIERERDISERNRERERERISERERVCEREVETHTEHQDEQAMQILSVYGWLTQSEYERSCLCVCVSGPVVHLNQQVFGAVF